MSERSGKTSRMILELPFRGDAAHAKPRGVFEPKTAALLTKKIEDHPRTLVVAAEDRRVRGDNRLQGFDHALWGEKTRGILKEYPFLSFK